MNPVQNDAIIARLNSDPEFRRALTSATDGHEAVTIAAAHGFTISTDDFIVALPDGELSDMELESVSGGGCNSKFWATCI